MYRDEGLCTGMRAYVQGLIRREEGLCTGMRAYAYRDEGLCVQG